MIPDIFLQFVGIFSLIFPRILGSIFFFSSFFPFFYLFLYFFFFHSWLGTERHNRDLVVRIDRQSKRPKETQLTLGVVELVGQFKLEEYLVLRT
jgi:hypothetical protein